METSKGIVYTDLDKEDISSWKYLLNNLTLKKIVDHFESYQDLCLRYMTTFERIENKINKLFNVEYYGHDFCPHFKHTITSDNEEKSQYYFFRIRRIEKGVYYDLDSENKILLETLEFKDMQILSDIWEKPANLVTQYQRLSKPQNSVLYTSLMPSTALLETNIEQESLFFLITYKNRKKFLFSDCCNFVYYNNLSEEENMKRYTIFQILRNEFTRVLPNSYDSEIQYCAAAAISDKFFISDDVDAIQYPSTRGIGHSNFAFMSKSTRECLEFVGFRCCKMDERIGYQSKYTVFADGFWNNSLKKFEYYSPNSDKSQRIYGDLLLNALILK